MRSSVVSRIPFFSLLTQLRNDIKTFVREEIQLAKTELTEKIGLFGKNAVSVAVGGFVAYTGLILFLAGLGFLLAYLFEHAGLSRLMASFLGFGAIGLLIAGVGAALLFKGLGGFKRQSLAPEKTIDSIKHIREPDPAKENAKEHVKMREDLEPKRSSQEIKEHVDSTQDVMKAHARELRHRMTPAYMGKSLAAGVRHHPVRSGIIGVASGLLGFLVLKHRRNHQHHNNHKARIQR